MWMLRGVCVKDEVCMQGLCVCVCVKGEGGGCVWVVCM